MRWDGTVTSIHPSHGTGQGKDTVSSLFLYKEATKSEALELEGERDLNFFANQSLLALEPRTALCYRKGIWFAAKELLTKRRGEEK